MARRIVAILAIAASSAVAAQRGPTTPCEPAGGATAALEMIDAARCYDERWAFADAERLLAASIAAVEAQRASTDEVVSSASVFVGGDVVAPSLSKPVSGDYPADAASRGITGIVIVGVTLKVDGNVRNAEIVESVPELDRAALQTVKKMRFAPTLIAGKPAEVSFFVPARFGLPEDPIPADWIRLAKAYFTHDHPGAAVQVLKLALDRERKEVARFGVTLGPGGRQGGYTRSGPAPQRIHNESPKYPPEALKARLGGTVIIEALVDLQGRVGRARVLRGVPGLDAAALDAVMKWTYAPTLVDGKPISLPLTVTVSFNVK